MNATVQPVAPKARRAKKASAQAPATVDPVLLAFYDCWHGDDVSPGGKAGIEAYLPKLQGTNQGEGLSQRRAWMAADWLVRTVSPAWLECLVVPAGHEPLTGYVTALRALAPVTNQATMAAATAVLNVAEIAVDEVCFDVRERGWKLAEKTVGEPGQLSRLREGIETATVEVFGAQALYAAANAARGPGEVRSDDVFAVEFPSPIACVLGMARSIAEVAPYALACGMVTSAAADPVVEHRAAVKATHMVLSMVSGKLKASAHELFRRMIAGAAPVEAALMHAEHRVADVFGQFSDSTTAQRRSWQAIDWLVRRALRNLAYELGETLAYADMLADLEEIRCPRTLAAAHAAVRAMNRDAALILDEVTAPYRDPDEDGVDFCARGAGVSAGAIDLYYDSLASMGVVVVNLDHGNSGLVGRFEQRARTQKGYDRTDWNWGIDLMLNEVAQAVEGVMHHVMLTVILRALIDENGKLASECHSFGPAAAALEEVVHQIREAMFDLHADAIAGGNV